MNPRCLFQISQSIVLGTLLLEQKKIFDFSISWPRLVLFLFICKGHVGQNEKKSEEIKV